MRRRGLVAVARQVLMALGRFVEPGECPAGAALKEAEGICQGRGASQPGSWWGRPVQLPGPCRSRRREGGASHRPSRSRPTTPRASGAGWLSSHGEKVVGDRRVPTPQEAARPSEGM
jgi:hypothetical protein